MSVVNISELKGTFQETPFAELLTEVAQSGLSGSFRLAHLETKAIVYVNNGEIAFAVSNLRQHRLYQILLQNNKIEKDTLAQIPNFTNDLELSQILIDKDILDKTSADEMFCLQIVQIIENILSWKTGGWSFSHLAQAKEGVHYDVNLNLLLTNYARNMSDDAIVNRFKSFDERFALAENQPLNPDLLPLEGFILSRMTREFVRIEAIKNQCGLSNAEILKTLYVLWLGNVIARKNWNSAFSESQIKDILSAKLTLKKAATVVTSSGITIQEDDVLELPTEEIAELDEDKLLEKYLHQVEIAESYYEILDVPVKANNSELKIAYFNLAKKYHPDRYHQEVDKALQQRVQNAFSEIARAYDTLKDEKARELYDFKLRKYLESIKDNKPVEVVGISKQPLKQDDKAREEFDQGFDLILNDQYEEAIPYLARAVQLMPGNASYHAYYGKALSGSTANQRFKAEAEIREAMKLDPENAGYRIMLVEFYIQFELLKRAEGELQRLLAQFPGNREAQNLLDSLAK